VSSNWAIIGSAAAADVHVPRIIIIISSNSSSSSGHLSARNATLNEPLLQCLFALAAVPIGFASYQFPRWRHCYCELSELTIWWSDANHGDSAAVGTAVDIRR